MKKLLLVLCVMGLVLVLAAGVACGSKSEEQKVKDAINSFYDEYNSAVPSEMQITVSDVSDVQVTDSTATAMVTLSVGGETMPAVEMALNKVGDNWVLDTE